jgi:hypothetical protein
MSLEPIAFTIISIASLEVASVWFIFFMNITVAPEMGFTYESFVAFHAFKWFIVSLYIV